MLSSEAIANVTIVTFGRPNGRKMEGLIIKKNAKTAIIRSAHALCSVAWELCTPINGVAPSICQPALKFNMFDTVNNHILEAIYCLYGNLSPENLTCDGEISGSQIRQRSAKYHAQLKHLFAALGRSVSEQEIYILYM